jgi:hypothetical protein
MRLHDLGTDASASNDGFEPMAGILLRQLPLGFDVFVSNSTI